MAANGGGAANTYWDELQAAYGPNGTGNPPAPNIVSASDHGVVFDGVTDVTVALTAVAALAVAANLPLLLPIGTGIVTAWAPPSGIVVQGIGTSLTKLKMASAAVNPNTVAVDVSSTVGVTMQNMTIDGNFGAFAAVNTEFKHALRCQDVTALTLSDMVLTNAKGDGLYIGSAVSHSVGIRATRVSCTNNYRNNCSIIDLQDGKFVACDFTGALVAGTPPQAGLDIEPDFSSNIIDNVRFSNCSFKNNAICGLQVAMIGGVATSSSLLSTGSPITTLPVAALPQAIKPGLITITAGGTSTATQTFATVGAAQGATTIPITSATPTFAFPSGSAVKMKAKQGNVWFTNCAFDNNTQNGILTSCINDVNFVGCSASGNGAQGVLFTATDIRNVTFSACDVNFNGTHGIDWGLTTGALSTNMKFADCKVQDNGVSSPGTYNGINLTPQSGCLATHIHLLGNTVGNTTSANQNRGMLTNQLVGSLKSIGNDWTNNVASTNGALYNDDATTRTRYGNDGEGDVANAVVTQVMLSINRFVQSNSAAGAITLTLPSQMEQGALYTFFDTGNLAGTNTITIIANSGQAIKNNGGVCTITTNGGTAVLYGRGSSWYVLSIK